MKYLILALVIFPAKVSWWRQVSATKYEFLTRSALGHRNDRVCGEMFVAKDGYFVNTLPSGGARRVLAAQFETRAEAVSAVESVCR